MLNVKRFRNTVYHTQVLVLTLTVPRESTGITSRESRADRPNRSLAHKEIRVSRTRKLQASSKNQKLALKPQSVIGNTALARPRFTSGNRKLAAMNAMAAAQLDKRRADVVFFENRDDLRLGEARLAHRSFLSTILAGKPTILSGPTIRDYVESSKNHSCNISRKRFRRAVFPRKEICDGDMGYTKLSASPSYSG